MAVINVLRNMGHLGALLEMKKADVSVTAVRYDGAIQNFVDRSGTRAFHHNDSGARVCGISPVNTGSTLRKLVLARDKRAFTVRKGTPVIVATSFAL